MQEYLTKERLTSFIQAAFQEDVGEGDHSTLATVPAEQPGKAQLLIKEPGVIAGLELAKMIFHFHDPELRVETLVADGQTVGAGQIGFRITGKAASILTTERLVLNCMQRMSGIATKTKAMNALIQHTNVRLLDTRKTTPNFRMLEKWAVSIGGGKNHRFALYDMIMLKDNHIDFAGGISRAINAAKTYLQRKELDLKIEIETRSLDEVRKVMRVGGVDIIMLDNMDIPTMKEAVRMIGGRYETEASGGIDEQRIVPIAESGVDYISVGALTHHVKSLDISLKAVRSPQQTAD